MNTNTYFDSCLFVLEHFMINLFIVLTKGYPIYNFISVILPK